MNIKIGDPEIIEGYEKHFTFVYDELIEKGIAFIDDNVCYKYSALRIYNLIHCNCHGSASMLAIASTMYGMIDIVHEDMIGNNKTAINEFYALFASPVYPKEAAEINSIYCYIARLALLSSILNIAYDKELSPSEWRRELEVTPQSYIDIKLQELLGSEDIIDE